jgi:hypothetical protein
VEAHRIVRRRGSHIFLDSRFTDGGEVVKNYALAVLYPQEDSWYSFLLEAESNLGSQCGWKDLVNLKNPVTSSGIEPATFRLVV